MTQVFVKAGKVKRNGHELFTYTVLSEGHSGYSENGSDIVCASLSSALELVMDILEKSDIDFDTDFDGDVPKARLSLSCTKEQSEMARRIIEGYAQFVSDLSESYPEFVEITTEV